MLESLINKVTKSGSTSATSNEEFLQRVTSDFLGRATSATSNKRILQRVTSDFCNKQLLQGVMSEFCNEKRMIFSKEQLLQHVRSNELFYNE